MDNLISRLVILLICHRIGVRRHQRFRFAGQNNDAWSVFGQTRLWRLDTDNCRESRLGLNYLLNAAVKEVAP